MSNQSKKWVTQLCICPDRLNTKETGSLSCLLPIPFCTLVLSPILSNASNPCLNWLSLWHDYGRVQKVHRLVFWHATLIEEVVFNTKVFYFTNTNANNSCPKRLVGNVKRKYSHQYVLITSLILPLCVHQPQSEKKHARVFNKICLLYVWGNKQQVVQVFFTGRTSPLDHNNQRVVLSKVSTAQLEWHKFLVKSIAIR